MNVLIIGSGAREHAFARAVAASPRVERVFVAPGNGGTALMGGKVCNVPLKAVQLDELLVFARESGIGLTVVGPEQPLEMGLVDLFRKADMKVVGPVQAAARLESSKVFSKEFMRRHGIPTAGYRVFGSKESAMAHIGSLGEEHFPQVIKASGLCAGKGVIVADGRNEALSALREIFDDRIFGSAADEVVIEDFLRGQEASVFALCDGCRYRLFLSAQDHKRIGDGDTGKNTGGMGAYAPAPLVTPEVMRKVEERVIRPTLEGMASEGSPYTGFLYVGLMIEGGEPSVVEFNARLGDPETQVVLPLLKSDLFDALLASVDGGLDEVPFEMHPGSAATVVVASGGYPDVFETGRVITIDSGAESQDEVMIFHAGTVLDDGRLVTSGGRVLSVTALGPNLKVCLERAYRAVGRVHFDGAYYRRDIGAKAL
ncbi:MAG: phosphoribosylamine--glycine ligase [Chlorobium sp.]|uniref:phosphoribosylamine--glycine ligase n=1 Tax=Chlorobium sp. TaxID=1095 RepID=UPI0025C4E9C0|nr:phosphoribosylamine--glycine ligase [Chlorobium sp.]MCF8383987.1 phosphoribosylamine--glycine ligase [Chlorobium sp.]